MRFGFLTQAYPCFRRYNTGQANSTNRHNSATLLPSGVANVSNILIRKALPTDQMRIVGIYNESIPGRLATADLEPVSVEDRRAWFAEHAAPQRPLWVAEAGHEIAAWLGLRSFYGRPAYHHTVEVSVYVGNRWQRRGIAAMLLQEALNQASGLEIQTLLAFIFGHNRPSIALFERFGFTRWGNLPRIAVLDEIERDLVIYGRRLDSGT